MLVVVGDFQQVRKDRRQGLRGGFDESEELEQVVLDEQQLSGEAAALSPRAALGRQIGRGLIDMKVLLELS